MATALPTEKKQLLLNEINTIKFYTDIMDKAIEQRVNLYSDIIQESIKTNTDLKIFWMLLLTDDFKSWSKITEIYINSKLFCPI